MKVGIITFTNTVNFGASLQAYALQEVLGINGADAEVIRYKNKDIEKKEKNTDIKSFKSIIKSLVMGNGIKKKAVAFQNYEKDRIKDGLELLPDTVEKVNSAYDYFITGSDQVWNMSLTHEDWTYFLDFVKDENKIVSYAPSFGNVPFPEEDYEIAGKYLKRFKSLSVREASGSQLIKKMIGRDAEVVLDPTLLLNKKAWSDRVSFVPKLEHYILVYFPHNKKLVFDFVEKLKAKTGLPVIYLSISPRPQSGVKTIYDASPDEFLGWMKNADYVVTGSFHGTAFSLNLEKQFFYEPSGKGSRIDNLVTLTGTESRCITNNNVFDEKIDYSVVSEKLDSERKNSLKWLKDALNLK